MTDFPPKSFVKHIGHTSGPKKFDLGASHPRPEIRPAAQHPTPYSPNQFADPVPQSPEFGPISSSPSTPTMDPMRLRSQDLPPHQLEAQTWAPKPATSHTPEQFFAPQPQQNQHTSVSGHFVPADQLLKDMGMAPLKAPPTSQEADQTTSKPYVEPHKSSMAEFSPPRPTRRTLTVFAHLKNTPEDK